MGLSLKSSRFLSNRWGPPHWSDYGYDEKFPQWRLATVAAFDMVLVKYQHEPDGEWDDVGYIDISHEGYRLMMWDKEIATCDGGTENIFNAIVALVPEPVDAAAAPTDTPDATNKKKAASKASKVPRKSAPAVNPDVLSLLADIWEKSGCPTVPDDSVDTIVNINQLTPRSKKAFKAHKLPQYIAYLDDLHTFMRLTDAGHAVLRSAGIQKK